MDTEYTGPIIPEEYSGTVVPDAPLTRQQKMSATLSKFKNPPEYNGKLLGDVGDFIGKAAYNAGGWVTDKAANMGASPEVSAGLGTAANFATQAIPAFMMGGRSLPAHPGSIQSAASLIGNVAEKPSFLRGMAESVMQNAVKPAPKDLATGKAQRAIGTMLDEGYSPTVSSTAKLKADALRQNAIVEQAINDAKNAGVTIPKGSAPSRIQPLISDLEQKNALPSAQRAAMEGVYDEYLSNPLIPNQIPVDRAQQFKQTLYTELKNKYGTLSEGSEAAKKALARGLREDLESAVPGVVAPNAKASELWNALNVAERRALIQGNNSIPSLPFLAGNPQAMGAFTAARSQYIKSMLAHALNSLDKGIPMAARNAVATLPIATRNSRETQAGQQQ